MTSRSRGEGAAERRFSGDAGWMEGVKGGRRGEYSVARHGRLVSASCPAGKLAAARFLRAAEGQERFLWRDGRQGITLAGTGVAAHLIGYGRGRFDAIERQASELFASAETGSGLRRGPGDSSELALPRLFGGFAFREDFVPDMVWTGFHPGHFILPHYQFVSQEGESWLTINALLAPEERASSVLPLLEEALAAQAELLCKAETGVDGQAGGLEAGPGDEPEIAYPMPYAEWAQLVEGARDAFARTALQKVVLARTAQLRAGERIGISQALTRLCGNYPDCFGFLFEPQAGHAFLGATPELLVRVRGAALETMALAGSIQRGATEEADAALAAALLASSKDRHEHGLVVNGVRELLAPLSSELTVADEPTVLVLRNIQHLYTPITAMLKNGGGVLPLVERLHPTPAMGGTPRELGMDFIQKNEPTLRGWYAAPVGWIDSAMDGAFAVAIRSAIVQKERAWAYAGAGIVPDSVPRNEWDETGWKFQPIINAVAGRQVT